VQEVPGAVDIEGDIEGVAVLVDTLFAARHEERYVVLAETRQRDLGVVNIADGSRHSSHQALLVRPRQTRPHVRLSQVRRETHACHQ